MIDLREELARASAMLDVRRFDEASALLARVVSAEPESSRAWCLMARAHLGAERYTDAISAANRAVSLDPSDEWPHRLASNALVHLGNFPDALRAADEACRLAPGYWQTHVCVAQAALAGQRPGVAAEAASRARARRSCDPFDAFVNQLEGFDQYFVAVAVERADIVLGRPSGMDRKASLIRPTLVHDDDDYVAPCICRVTGLHLLVPVDQRH